MTVAVGSVNTSTDTFQSWITKFNLAANAISTQAVTVDGTANGSGATGNSFVNGHMAAVSFSTLSLSGGNNQASAVLPVSSNVSVGNSTVNTLITFGSVQVGGYTVNTGGFSGGNTNITGSGWSIGNSTVNNVGNSTSISIGGAAVATTKTRIAVSNGGSVVTEGILNLIAGSGITIGVSDDSADGFANVTINATAVSGGGPINVGSNAWLNYSQLFIGNATSNTILTQGVGLFSTSVNVGSNVSLSTAGFTAGNSTVNTTHTSTGITLGATGTVAVGNSTINVAINSSSIQISGNTVPTSNQVYLLSAQGQVISGGASIQSNNQGTKNSGTFSPNVAICPLQYISSNGAFTLAACTALDGVCDILIVNGSAAGAITFSGFTVSANTGDALDTTQGHKFLLQIRTIDAVSTYNLKALQ